MTSQTFLVPLAHAGEAHWYDTLMFVTPMLVIAVVLWWTGRKERRADERQADAAKDQSPESPPAARAPVQDPGAPEHLP